MKEKIELMNKTGDEFFHPSQKKKFASMAVRQLPNLKKSHTRTKTSIRNSYQSWSLVYF
jgi:hypothetical protein